MVYVVIIKTHCPVDEPYNSNYVAFLALTYSILPPLKGVDRTAVLDTEACIISHYQVFQNENSVPDALVQPLSSLLKSSYGVGRQTGYDVCQGDRCLFCKIIFWS